MRTWHAKTKKHPQCVPQLDVLHCLQVLSNQAVAGDNAHSLTRSLCTQPRAINVQPTLIAIAPVDTISNPTGVNVEPYGIAVTGK